MVIPLPEMVKEMKELDVLVEIRDLIKGMKIENSTDDFLTSTEVAGMLKISVGHFVNVISKRDGFPDPVSTSENGRKMWRRSDVVGYLK